MRYLLLLLLFSAMLFGDIKESMLRLYEKQRYKQACDMGFEHFKRYKRDERFLMLYGFSCLKSDFIDRLALPIAMLKYSKEARLNAAYFAVVMMQKKLLYHALLDGYALERYRLPTSTHILSKVFDAYAALGKHKPKRSYSFVDPSSKAYSYKLYLDKRRKPYRMIIEEYYKDRLIKRHSYW